MGMGLAVGVLVAISFMAFIVGVAINNWILAVLGLAVLALLYLFMRESTRRFGIDDKEPSPEDYRDYYSDD
ncbi:MAG TPA: hypothetical protein VMR18_03750 [Candidatus Saccharimonadales bacterium]|nr:hypothetical protein [Candidatus Saccharimonadales bacterium]